MALNPNYQNRTLDEQDTYNHKKHYDTNIYVVFTEQHFYMNLGNIVKKFIIFIKQRGEQFGDPLPAYDLGGKLPLIRVYDNAGNIMLNSSALQNTDTYIGEWQYTFNQFDFNKTGLFNGEVILFNDSSESVIGNFKINVS